MDLSPPFFLQEIEPSSFLHLPCRAACLHILGLELILRLVANALGVDNGIEFGAIEVFFSRYYRMTMMMIITKSTE